MKQIGKVPIILISKCSFFSILLFDFSEWLMKLILIGRIGILITQSKKKVENGFYLEKPIGDGN